MARKPPKRWNLDRRQARDRSLRWKAFWAAVFFFFLALLWMLIDFASQGWLL